MSLLLQLINTKQQQFEKWVLTAEGLEVVASGSHEARVYHAVEEETGTLQADIMVRSEMYTLTVKCSVNSLCSVQ